MRSPQPDYLASVTNYMLRKGKGLILLLHGAPGVGKTSTAGGSIDVLLSQIYSNHFTEGVAEMFGKPLFQITCGMFSKIQRRRRYLL